MTVTKDYREDKGTGDAYSANSQHLKKIVPTLPSNKTDVVDELLRSGGVTLLQMKWQDFDKNVWKEMVKFDMIFTEPPYGIGDNHIESANCYPCVLVKSNFRSLRSSIGPP